ncbi:hypothetical protein [Stagnihabitans tardus]|uniref:Uncharacterized protein n=1 Tax=Stagnihabitans tardus TaxID=2699202 RepID=A0AAE4YDV5_9RHOB|nr:hypothetical protein [Stagnihabitans tardus]NBZ89852.1 hypothetical protein [Stagnihabitans tardus]
MSAAFIAVDVAVDIEASWGLGRLLWISTWAGLGAGLAAFGLSGWGGRPGWRGWARAYAAAVLCSLCGGFAGGTAVYPIFGTLFGPPVAFWMMVSPKLMPLWWGGFVLVQLLALRLRARLGAGGSAGGG